MKNWINISILPENWGGEMAYEIASVDITGRSPAYGAIEYGKENWRLRDLEKD